MYNYTQLCDAYSTQLVAKCGKPGKQAARYALETALDAIVTSPMGRIQAGDHVLAWVRGYRKDGKRSYQAWHPSVVFPQLIEDAEDCFTVTEEDFLDPCNKTL